MSSRSLSKPTNHNHNQNALAQIKQNIPIQLSDRSIFDNSYAFMRDRFAQEMKRIDQQMLKFRYIDNAFSLFNYYMDEHTCYEQTRSRNSDIGFISSSIPVKEELHNNNSDLTLCFGETSDSGCGTFPNDQVTYDILQNSPLVTGEGEEKALRLQFDVSAFDPSEIKVKILNDMLIISATHEEKTKDTSVYREYNRTFKLPPGTNPDSLVSSLSRDGVLTIHAPLMLSTLRE